MKKGFTLSEVLITLGVVGVVAVLTIPGVMKNYQNRLYTAQLEKIYSQISDAAQAIMNDEHVDNFYETTANNAIPTSGDRTLTGAGYFLTKYFKTVKKDCALTTATSPCISTATGFYKTVGGTNITHAINNNYYFVQTVTGATIGANYNPTHKCVSLVVDVNGLSEPNIAGRDIFSMDIKSNGTISDYGTGCAGNGIAASQCTSYSNTSLIAAPAGCLNNVIEAGWKMEY